MQSDKFQKLRISSRNRKLLSLLFRNTIAITSVAGLTALFVVFPGLPIAFNFLLRQINKEKSKSSNKLYPSDIRKNFEQMKKKRLIKIVHKNNEIKITLLKEGTKVIVANNINNLKFKKPEKWDNKWRIIMFDIPEKNKKERDFFVRKIKEMNFYRLQKSVFVYPYPPNEIVDFLSEVFGISAFVRVVEAVKIEGEEEILKHFELTR